MPHLVFSKFFQVKTRVEPLLEIIFVWGRLQEDLVELNTRDLVFLFEIRFQIPLLVFFVLKSYEGCRLLSSNLKQGQASREFQFVAVKSVCGMAIIFKTEACKACIKETYRTLTGQRAVRIYAFSSL